MVFYGMTEPPDLGPETRYPGTRMRIIDANTGAEVKVGQTFTNIDGTHTLIKVREGLLKAEALLRTHSIGDPRFPSVPLGDRWVPLVVRYTHPGFFLQKVGFIPS